MSWSLLAVPIYWYDNQVSAFCLLDMHVSIVSAVSVIFAEVDMSSLKLAYFFVGIWVRLGLNVCICQMYTCSTSTVAPGQMGDLGATV